MEEDLTKHEAKNELESNYPKSIYTQDFQIISAKRPDPIIFKPDYTDIIAGPFLDPLLLDSQGFEADQEGADDFYKRVLLKYPSLKKVVLSELIDQSKVIEEHKALEKSLYQSNYSSIADDSHKPVSRVREKIKLPEEFGPIPRTTHRRYYREWKKILPWDIKPAQLFLPEDSDVGMSREDQEILNVTTGKSEYQENISDCGQQIMDYAFYGEVKILPHEFRKKN